MADYYGKLLIMGKDGCSGQQEFPIDKRSILIGRDHGCDIRLMNKEISRKHAEIYVGDSGGVHLCSMGREPVSVNSTPALSPVELVSGDKIEVHLEGRTRVFFYHGVDDTLQIGARSTLGQLNTAGNPQGAVKAGKRISGGGADAAARMPPPPPVTSGAAKAQSSAPSPRPHAQPEEQGNGDRDMEEQADAGVEAEPAVEAPPAAIAMKEAGEAEPAPQEGNQEGELAEEDALLPEPTEMLAEMLAEAQQALFPEPTGVLMLEPATKDAGVGGAPASVAPPGSTARKARKSVRFDATPEGAPRDATLTIRLRKGDLEQVITVDDNTLAFSNWALGSMLGAGCPEEDGDLPDTVVSRKSRSESGAVLAGSAEGSVRKSPVPEALRTMFSEAAAALKMTPLCSAKAGPTPAGPGARAPAPTPNTAAALSGPAFGVAAQLGTDAVSAASLAAKLAELAEEHDVTFDLPADFMRFTPATGKKTFSIVMTPRSAAAPGSKGCAAGKSPGGSALASAAKSVPRTTPRSRLGQAIEPAGEGTMEVEQALQLAPAGSTRKPARRSSIRTPGTKIAIIGHSTPRAGSTSVNPAARPPPPTVDQPARPNSTAVDQDTGGEAGQAARGESHTAGPSAPSTLAMQCDEDEADGRESAGEQEDAVDEGAAAFGAADAALGVQTVPLVDYRRAILKAKAYRSQSRQLAVQLHGVAARAARLRRAAAALATALEKERGQRLELQEAMRRIVANRAAATEEEGAMSEREEEVGTEQLAALEEESEAPVLRRVVVVGYNPAPVPVRTERAGCVVVVHPAPPAAAQTVAAARARTPATTRKTPAAVRSARKTPSGKTPGTGGTVVVDDVEVPAWVFEEGGKGGADVAAELAMVASADAAEAAERQALQQISAHEEAVPEEEEAAAEEDDEEEDDSCHVCGAGEEGDVLLLCDSCDNACHLACCAPPLKRVPKGDWFCKECVAKRAPQTAAKKGAKRGGKSAAGEPAAGAKRARGAAAAEAPAVEHPKPKRSRAAAPAKEAPAAPRGRATRCRH